MLTIRLQRSGKKNKPEFRIILAEKTSAANKKFTEILGHYNPRTKEFGLKEDRLQYWMSQHVTLSPTVHNLLVTKKIIEALKVKAFTIPKKAAEPVADTPAVKVSASPEATGAADDAEATSEDAKTEALVEEVIAETSGDVLAEPAAAPAEPAKKPEVPKEVEPAA